MSCDQITYGITANSGEHTEIADNLKNADTLLLTDTLLLN